QAAVGPVPTRRLADPPPPLLHLEPPGALLVVVERRLDGLQLDQERRLRRVPLGETAHLELRVARALLGRERDHLVLAAVEEDVEAPVGLAGRALRLARARDAVDQLERRPLRARDRHRVAPEGGHGEDRLLPAAGGDGGAAEGGFRWVGGQGGRGGEREEEADDGRSPATLRRAAAPPPHPERPYSALGVGPKTEASDCGRASWACVARRSSSTKAFVARSRRR